MSGTRQLHEIDVVLPKSIYFTYKSVGFTIKYKHNILFLIADISEASFDYERTANNLWAISKFVHQALTSTPVDEFEQKFSNKLNWTGNREAFLDCFSLIHSGDALAAQVAMLLMSSLLERTLGDLYMTVANTSQCPSLLKDLLSTSELKELFGNTAITCLHVLIGPPCGLNLRNILWHGFIAPGEIPVE